MPAVDDYLDGLDVSSRAAFELSKGTIRFTAATPLPDDVVRDIVRLRMDEIIGTDR